MAIEITDAMVTALQDPCNQRIIILNVSDELNEDYVKDDVITIVGENDF